MDEIRIRPATRQDISAVDALLARSYPTLLKKDYPPSVLVTALPLISKANPKLVTCGTYYVAEGQEGLVGAGGWTFVAPGQARSFKGRGNIRHVVTDHRLLRRGIARALMQRVFDEAAAAGATALDCLSTRTAVPFYQSMGFKPLREISLELQPGIAFHAIKMERAL